ncbi:MAG: oligosaccharide flippase family protein [Gemmatimonadetes bacterium]|nr:oligosaccharide flippase family protein [Gemmatimonadota bacterium]
MSDAAEALPTARVGAGGAGAASRPGAAEPPASRPASAGRLAGRRLLAANAASLVLAYALPRAFTFGAAVVAARALGAAGFGAYGTAAAFAVVLSILATLGMQPLLVRRVARSPERAPEILAAAHLVKLGASVLMLAALLVLAGPVLRYPGEVAAAAALLGLAYAIGAFVENLAAYFQGVERMHVWSQASALCGLVSGAVGVAVVLVTRDVVAFCTAPALGQLAALGWLLRRAPAAVRRPARAALADARELAGSLAPYAAAYVATTVYYKGDVLLLAHWRAPAEVGLYAAAYRFLDVGQALALAVAGALVPQLARAGERAARTAWRAVRLALLCTIPAAAALALLRAPVVGALYGAGYAEAAPVLGALAAALAPLVVNMVALSALSAAGNAGAAARLYLAAAALKLALDAVLIPARGAGGAALAALLSEMALAAGFALALRRAAAAAARDGGALREAA